MEQPNDKINRFNGTGKIKTRGNNGQFFDFRFDIKNMILRGTTLKMRKEEDYILGVVVQAGEDTKIERNKVSIKREKMSKNEQNTRLSIVILALVVIVASLSLAIFELSYERSS